MTDKVIMDRLDDLQNQINQLKIQVKSLKKRNRRLGKKQDEHKFWGHQEVRFGGPGSPVL